MLAVLDMTSVAIHSLQKWPPKLQVPEMSLMRANGITTVATRRSEKRGQTLADGQGDQWPVL